MSLTRRFVALLLVLLPLVGCSLSGEDSGKVDSKLAALSDVPLPRGYDVDRNATIIFGEGDRWSGKLVYSIGSSPDDMFTGRRRERPKRVGTEISVLRAATSVMTFRRADRVATIQISANTIYGSHVEMVVAPASQPNAEGGGGLSPSGTPADAPANRRPDGLPPPGQTPDRGVTVQPVR